MEALQEGWAPLRWCLTAEPAVAYPGGEVHVDLRLADEDVLSAGRHTATVAWIGPDGRRGECQAVIDVPQAGQRALAVPVLEETIRLGDEPGELQIAARLDGTASPRAGRAVVQVLAAPPASPPATTVRLAGGGLDASASEWLARRGVDTTGGLAGLEQADLVLVAHPGTFRSGKGPDEAARIEEHLVAGGTAVVLSPWELIETDENSGPLPFGVRGTCDAFYDWLYHKECFAKAHPLFAGLGSAGLLDWERYGTTLPRHLLESDDLEEVAGAAFAVGYACPGGYRSGVIAGTYRRGAGHLVVSCFDVLGVLGTSPVGDHLAANLIAYGATLAACRT